MIAIRLIRDEEIPAAKRMIATAACLGVVPMWDTGLSQINVRQLSFLSICLFHREDRKERKEKKY
jgi:hypothetical protein